jgi:hypothetical protein
MLNAIAVARLSCFGDLGLTSSKNFWPLSSRTSHRGTDNDP